MKHLLDFCHWVGKKGYKINGYDDSQLMTIIEQFKTESESPTEIGQQGVVGAKEFLQEKIKNGGWTKLNKLPFSLYEAVSIVMQEYAAIRFKEMTARCNNYFEEVAELKATIQAKSAINKIHANDIERLQSECDYFKKLYEETVKKLDIKFPDTQPTPPQEGQDELKRLKGIIERLYKSENWSKLDAKEKELFWNDFKKQNNL